MNDRLIENVEFLPECDGPAEDPLTHYARRAARKFADGDPMTPDDWQVLCDMARTELQKLDLTADF